MLRGIAIFFILVVAQTNAAIGQFSPPAGVSGSKALHKDTSLFVDWGSSATINHGFKNISVPDSGLVGPQSSDFVKGKADGKTVSLGDGGSAIVTFANPIYNGLGPDFAVFENSFDGQFLELAFVEVSSNGLDFYRFESTSLTDTNTQVGTFGILNPEKINNLAGTFKVFYGTPFDLEELKDKPGLDVNNITHVKVIDVIGSINPLYAGRDAAGRKINDPWPTPFKTGGFDLDAIGVIHSKGNSLEEISNFNPQVYPTITRSREILTINCNQKITDINLIQLDGKRKRLTYNPPSLELPELPQAIYFLEIITKTTKHFVKIAVE